MKKFFENLFNKKSSPPPPAVSTAVTAPLKGPKRTNDAETAPLSEDQLEQLAQGENRINPMQLIVGAARDVGKTRDKNEDS